MNNVNIHFSAISIHSRRMCARFRVANPTLLRVDAAKRIFKLFRFMEYTIGVLTANSSEILALPILRGGAAPHKQLLGARPLIKTHYPQDWASGALIGPS